MEGEAYFILLELQRLTKGKKVEYNPDFVPKSLSMLDAVDHYVYLDPDKQTAEKINHDRFIVCFLDKNLDLRLDYVKKLKAKSTYQLFEPIPSTDFQSLRGVFPDLKKTSRLPTKKVPLKYKGQKQNYEWYDLCLISDLISLGDSAVFDYVFEGFFDIWQFTDDLWNGNPRCISQVENINDKNFEDYFNRIRETSKDYLELMQTKANNYYDHKKKLPSGLLNNQYRFEKVKEKLDMHPGKELWALEQIEQCLKNVRLGSNPKLTLIELVTKFQP